MAKKVTQEKKIKVLETELTAKPKKAKKKLPSLP
jgi:hypothetical protein